MLGFKTSSRRRKLVPSALVAAMVLLSVSACGGASVGQSEEGAGSASSSLESIMGRKELRVGTQYSFPNWGFLDAKREPAGFDIDMANAMAKDLGVKLTLVETSLDNRIPYLQSNRVDIVFGVFSKTPERALAVDFSNPYGALVAQLVSNKDDGINGPSDLGGKTVAVTKGNTSSAAIRAAAPKDTKFMEFTSPSETFLALKQGKVDAAVQGLTGVNEFTKQNPKFQRKGDPIEPSSMIAAGIKKGNAPLLKKTNDWLAKMDAADETQKLYKQWFEIDRPPLTK